MKTLQRLSYILMLAGFAAAYLLGQATARQTTADNGRPLISDTAELSFDDQGQPQVEIEAMSTDGTPFHYTRPLKYHMNINGQEVTNLNRLSLKIWLKIWSTEL